MNLEIIRNVANNTIHDLNSIKSSLEFIESYINKTVSEMPKFDFKDGLSYPLLVIKFSDGSSLKISGYAFTFNGGISDKFNVKDLYTFKNGHDLSVIILNYNLTTYERMDTLMKEFVNILKNSLFEIDKEYYDRGEGD